MLYDYKCTKCDKEKKDEWVMKMNQEVLCDCGTKMERMFPDSGNFDMKDPGIKKMKNQYGSDIRNIPQRATPQDNGVRIWSEKRKT